MVGTYLAVEEVLAKSLANSTNSTVVTVIYALLTVIVPKLANIAVVLSSLLVAVSAILCCRLSMAAQHTQHVLRIPANERMVLDCIMAKPTRVPFFTSIALQLDIPLIVLAAQDGFVAFFRIRIIIGSIDNFSHW